MNLFLSGATGRLGRVIAETFAARYFSVLPIKRAAIKDRTCNYLVFSHRYRGDPDYRQEMYWNVEWVADTIQRTQWAGNDNAIVIVSSVLAQKPCLTQSLAYNLSKAALNNMARYLAKSQAVRVNTVSPVVFTGDKPTASAQEVSNVVSFLCSDKASGINGQDILVG